jgi:hypothetical protein
MRNRPAWLFLTLMLLAVPLAPSASASTQGDGTDVESTPAPAVAQPIVGEAILPKYRILSYYGFPGNEFMVSSASIPNRTSARDSPNRPERTKRPIRPPRQTRLRDHGVRRPARPAG